MESPAADQWPEPIIPVQSLSESGITTIPDNYVKPISARPIITSAQKDDGPVIPVVDLGCGPTDLAVMQAIAGACREWGFFQVVNHGVSLELMNKVVEVWKEFYKLSMEVKKRYSNSPKTLEGYGSRLGLKKGAVLDWGDYYFLNLLPELNRNYDKWSALPVSFRATIEEYVGELVKLCKTILKALSVSLGLKESYLEEAFGGGVDACMRTNYYPKCPQPELTLGLSPHSDPGGLTILLSDERVNSLQVHKGDDWVTVQPVRNAFIVNVGDQIQVLSNAIYKSVEHRVTVNSEAERLSVAFFYNPTGDRVIEPAPELVKSGGRRPCYASMTFNEYRMFVRTNGPSGKIQVESLFNV